MAAISVAKNIAGNKGIEPPERAGDRPISGPRTL
jgi:hypothetical protein